MMAAQGSGVFTQFASRTAPCSVHHPLRCRGSSGRRGAIISKASETAAALLVEGKRVYEAGDRLAAMNIYEKALKEGPALSKEQRLAALYGSIAVHASFGDVELAQMVLRDAIQAGLDYEAALEDPANPEINSSQQILIQLTRFNKQFKRSIADRSEDIASQSAKAKAAGRKAANSSKVGADADLSRLLGPGMGKTDARAIDASPAAIAKRVALVVLAGIVLGVGLFFAGLEYMFPKI